MKKLIILISMLLTQNIFSATCCIKGSGQQREMNYSEEQCLNWARKKGKDFRWAYDSSGNANCDLAGVWIATGK
ncbi:TPA: hypothetical protein DIC20_05040 [Candidatus Dependentiae bacterium]|nr:MAG: hypothetical protein US03_C0007G0063 [candidate division TM6 bacterium GW2011_GWF2_36_131]KKQ02996.1 MAG: hypothetical protein US13_C0007G0006 [candidate division TM6 bacterium GW2011_GWE2_36_25]KKQ19553.1 MAG: hypothetical protein US32_C0007G0006 [candidate division TM6 bacterium GW2011_GWA2_36_9]HBR71066.1 hypothetical protein [Candidatus Dependentiae bacterium]HCU01037.1 hypothetical protein [Candidatus Dependentiae bacterium]